MLALRGFRKSQTWPNNCGESKPSIPRIYINTFRKNKAIFRNIMFLCNNLVFVSWNQKNREKPILKFLKCISKQMQERDLKLPGSPLIGWHQEAPTFWYGYDPFRKGNN